MNAPEGIRHVGKCRLDLSYFPNNKIKEEKKQIVLTGCPDKNAFLLMTIKCSLLKEYNSFDE